jgi:hypothetical protein
MKRFQLRALLTAAVAGYLALVSLPAATERMPIDEVRPGMTGVGVTVFDGASRTDFKVHILGVLRNSMGPRRDLILARLDGGPLAETGVIQGMSGSPVYINDRLVGAVSYSLGSFSKVPIAGITPIDEMIEVTSGSSERAIRPQARLELPVTQESLTGILREAFAATRPFAERPNDVGAIGLPAREAGQIGTMLRPITTPLIVNGFEPAVSELLAGAFGRAGFAAALGGTLAETQDREQPLQPGDPLGVGLIQGDLSMAGTGTVTMVEGDRVYGFGHPFYNVGPARFPMMRAYVHALLPSLAISSKIAAVGDVIGTIEQDRATAVFGRLGGGPPMIPIRITLESSARQKTDRFAFEVVEDPLLTPLLAYVGMLNTFFSHARELGATTYIVKGTARIKDHTAIAFEDIFTGAQAPLTAATAVAGPLTSLLGNDFERVAIDGVDLSIISIEEPRTATLERIWIEEPRPRAGRSVPLKIVARTYRGAEIVETILVDIPPHATGRLQILVSDGAQLGQRERQELRLQREARSIEQMIEALNTARKNNRLYIRLLGAHAGAVVRGETLSSLPPSVLAVLEGDRSGGSFIPLTSATIGEWEIRTDHFVSGSRLLTINVEAG